MSVILTSLERKFAIKQCLVILKRDIYYIYHDAIFDYGKAVFQYVLFDVKDNVITILYYRGEHVPEWQTPYEPLIEIIVNEEVYKIFSRNQFKHYIEEVTTRASKEAIKDWDTHESITI